MPPAVPQLEFPERSSEVIYTPATRPQSSDARTVANPLLALALVSGIALQSCDSSDYLGYWAAGAAAPGVGGNTPAPHTNMAGTMAAAAPVPTAGEPMSPTPHAVAGMQATPSTEAGGRAEPPDAGAAADGGTCVRARSAAGFEVTVTEANARLYPFADGAVFPAGHYRVAYVDGCVRFDATAAWTLHATVQVSPLTTRGSFLIMSDATVVRLAPGTSGVVVGPGAEPLGGFATYDECVAANLQVPPAEFQFDGGALGVMNGSDDSNDARTPGEAVGGRSPTFRLTRLDPCP